MHGAVAMFKVEWPFWPKRRSGASHSRPAIGTPLIRYVAVFESTMQVLFRRFLAVGLAVLLQAERSSCKLHSQLMQLQVLRSRATTSNETSSSAPKQHDGDRDKIVFIKLHKVGSSTLSSILHRYCDVHGKNCFVEPNYVHPGITVTESELGSIVTTFHSGTLPALDIWPNHVIMNTTMLDMLIPGNFKIALFRTPLTRTMSAFRHVNDTKWVDSMMASLMNNVYTNCSGVPSGMHLSDVMLLMSEQVSPEQVQELDLVMLTEQYDLSLMMLRRKLGWSMFDMVYRRQRADHALEVVAATAAFEEYLSQPVSALNEATRLYLQNCIGGNESTVYHFANRTFFAQWEKLSAQEQQEVKKDVSRFSAAQSLIVQCCHNNPADSYCVGLLEGDDPWTRRYLEQNRSYATLRLNGASVPTGTALGSSCKSLVKAALSSSAAKA
eukprot:2975776-Amphidinium_carterae.1